MKGGFDRSKSLQELEQEGVIDRTVIPETPVRVEYSLTKKGRALTEAMDAIAEWSEKWSDPESARAEKPVRVRSRA